MGKCIFTGEETNNKMLLFNKNLYVCDDVKSIIQKTIADPNSYVRVESFQKLLTLSENVDEQYKDTIDKFLIMLQQSNMEEHPVENDDMNIDLLKDEKNELENANDSENEGLNYAKYTHVASVVVKVLTILSLIGALIGAIVLFVFSDILYGCICLIALPIVIVISYIFEMLIIELCDNVAAKREQQELTNEYLDELISITKDQNKNNKGE